MPQILLILLALISSIAANAQNFRTIHVTVSDNGKILSDFLIQAEKDHQVDFICDMKAMRTYTLTGIVEQQRLIDYLEKNLTNFTIFKFSDAVIFIIDKSTESKFALNKDRSEEHTLNSSHLVISYAVFC